MPSAPVLRSGRVSLPKNACHHQLQWDVVFSLNSSNSSVSFCRRVLSLLLYGYLQICRKKVVISLEDSRKCNLCHQSIKFYFVLYFFFLQRCFISFSKGISDSVEIHGHKKKKKRNSWSRFNLALVSCSFSSCGCFYQKAPWGQVIDHSGFPSPLSSVLRLAPSLWLLTPGISLPLSGCACCSQTADRRALKL